MYEDKVKRGATLLDRVRPDWAAEIATDRLAMSTCTDCILGQLYGDYRVGCPLIVKQLPSTFLFVASEHGFTLPDRKQPDYSRRVMARFDRLADAWRAEIRKRLEVESRP